MKAVFTVDKEHCPPRLLKNGTPVYPMFFWQRSMEERDGRAFCEAGVEVFTFSYSFQSYEHPFYVAEETYDFSFFDGEIEKFRRACPGKYCIPRLFINAPYWWLEAHPEECVKYSMPTELYRHGVEPDNPQGTFHESFASELWKRDMGKALRMLIRHIKSSDYADCVVGLHLANGHCGEWHYWSGGLKPDISAPMLAYTKDADTTPEKRNWDYYDRFFEAEYDAILHFARIVKEESDGEYLNVLFYNYLAHSSIEACHGASDKILRTPEIDIIVSPHNYYFRAPGDSAYFRNFPASAAAHGKLFLDEADDRTWLVKRTHPRIKRPLGASTPEGSQMVIRREFGYALTHNAGLWYMDHDEDTFHDETLMKEIAIMRRRGAEAMQKERPRCSEVAVFYDMRGRYYLPKCFAGRQVYDLLPVSRLDNMCRAGAPFDLYLANDVCLPQAKNYKVLIFINMLAPSPEAAAAIEALKGDNRTLIWAYSSGLYDQNNRPAVENMTGLTGIDGFEMVESLDFPETAVQKGCTQCPGILPLEAEKDFDSWRSVYSWDPEFSIERLRQEYARAGVWNYLDTPDVIQLSSGALMIHARDAGVKNIRFPQSKVVTDIITGENLGSCQTLTLELKAAETRIFLLD